MHIGLIISTFEGMNLKPILLLSTSLFLLLTIFCSSLAIAQISMEASHTYYSQDFDALPATNSSIWENGAYFIPGWTVQRTKSGNTILANAGTSNAGALYSYGTTGSSDRALGSISSSTAGEFAYGLLLQNNTGSFIKSLDVSYFGEQWRVSNITAGEHKITFWYAISSDKNSFNLSPANDQAWKPVESLTFFSPVFFSSGKALDGNASANKRFLSKTLQVSIPPDHYIMLRWKDADDLEADHGLAIDDVAVSWKSVVTTGPSPLPVELVKFSATDTYNDVLLQWQTAMEEQNDYFVIERSPDGYNFKDIGFRNGAGFTKSITNYAFSDLSPLSGTSYYRLKQVDQDKKISYSSVVSVRRRSDREEVSVYLSNKFDSIFIEYGIKSNFNRVAILDSRGKQLADAVLLPGNNKHSINISNLASNIYFIMLLDDRNGKTITKRIVKL
jgi:hypothetical protein